MVKKKDQIRHHIEVITNPSGTYSWKYVMIYETLDELESHVLSMFKAMGLKGSIEIGGKIFEL